MNITAPQMMWAGFGYPEIVGKKWTILGRVNCCGHCGNSMDRSVHIDDIVTPIFSGTKEYFSSDTICYACAWMFSTREMNKTIWAFHDGEKFQAFNPNVKPKDNGRKQWLELLEEFRGVPNDTPCCGVLSTDFKVRKWHLMRPATRANFGLVIHAPMYDMSEYVDFQLDEMFDLINLINEVRNKGYKPMSILKGLHNDFKRYANNYGRDFTHETTLQVKRKSPAFIPALLLSS